RGARSPGRADLPEEQDRSRASGRSGGKGGAPLAPAAARLAPRASRAAGRPAPCPGCASAGPRARPAPPGWRKGDRARGAVLGGGAFRRAPAGPVAHAARFGRGGLCRSRGPAGAPRRRSRAPVRAARRGAGARRVSATGEDSAGAASETPPRPLTSSFQIHVVPLGTSAGRPTLSRGASALAIAAEGAWVLCDCGEGAQLAALEAGLSFSRLDAVLITHLHGDHFNGLPGLLGTMGLEGRERPMVVAGPRGIASLLETLARAGSLGVGGMPVHIVELDGDGGALDLAGETPAAFEVRARPLAHRVPTFGYRVALPDRPGTLDVEAAVAAGVPRGPLLAQVK